MTLAELRHAVAERQAKGIIQRTKNAVKGIPNASTRFQLEVELATRQAASREISRLKEKFKEKKRPFLERIWYGR